MTKDDILASVSAKADVSKALADKVIKALSETVSEALPAVGDKVKVHGLATFSKVERAARKGRNPQTGAEIQIPASVIVTAKAHIE